MLISPQRYSVIAIARPSVRQSVCLSHGLS